MALYYPSGGQYRAVSGLKPRNREQATRAFIQAQIPAMRSETRRKEDLALYQAEQEALASRHSEEMELEKERLEAEQEAQRESSELARQQLRLQEKSSREAERMGEWATWIQTASLALQAWQQWRNKDPWIKNYGYDSYDGGSGDGSDFEVDIITW